MQVLRDTLHGVRVADNRVPVILITGASSGIGEALALEYASRGADLVLLARRAERLAAVAGRVEQAGGRVLTITCDVRSDNEVSAAFQLALQTFGLLDAVIANAGFALTGRLEKLTLDDYRRQFETNVIALVRTAQHAVEPLKRSRGKLALVSSVAGYVAAPGMSPYAMSKFAVRAFGDSIREELRPHGISVTTICPGFVESEIRKIDKSGIYRADAPDPVPRWLIAPVGPAARQMVRAIEDRRAELVVTGHGKLLVFFVRHVPGLLRTVTRRFAKQLRNV